MKSPVEDDPYAVLGVRPNASQADLRAAYRARARERHPDIGGDEAEMRRLNAAYHLLRDPVRRKAHDKSREPASLVPDQPHWTGAAGPPPGRPSGSVLDFGLFAGWSLGEIARRDPGYLQWLAERPEGRPYAEEIERVVALHRESRFGQRRT
jgi:curved DNA-binding protein CbpA